eukprot:5404663-Prymnesium_polylepis.1
MGRVLIGAGGGRARGRRVTWTAATWAYRARRAGFFAQRRPGVKLPISDHDIDNCELFTPVISR